MRTFEEVVVGDRDRDGLGLHAWHEGRRTIGGREIDATSRRSTRRRVIDRDGSGRWLVQRNGEGQCAVVFVDRNVIYRNQ